jgi:hypothetical protein
MQIATLVFLVVLAGWCMLLIPAQTIARGWREIDAADRRATSNGFNGGENGFARNDDDVPRPRPERERTH